MLPAALACCRRDSMFSRTWRSLLDSFPRRGPSRLVTVASERQEDLSDCWGRACSGVGSCIGTEGARGWGRHPRTQKNTPGGTRNSWSTPSTSQPGTTRTRGDSGRTPREPPGNPPENRNSRPPEKRDFPAPRKFPPARGAPPGGPPRDPPRTPKMGCFLRAILYSFVRFRYIPPYTPQNPQKWPKKGSQKVSRFCPDWESY